MKQHKRIVIVISLALALILLVAALPALAQNNNTSISNFSYDGTDGSTNEYKLSWDTIANSSYLPTSAQKAVAYPKSG